MEIRITMIEDSRETQVRFLKSLALGDQVELQAITVDPFFDAEIEEAINAFDPDLIILDLVLKRNEESGFRVLRKLQESALLRDIPVVVCSKHIGNNPDDKNRVRAMTLGAVEALPKTPFPKAQDFFLYARKRRER